MKDGRWRIYVAAIIVVAGLMHAVADLAVPPGGVSAKGFIKSAAPVVTASLDVPTGVTASKGVFTHKIRVA